MKITSAYHKLSGTVTVPGSKSHTIRAVLLSTLATGTSYIKNPLASADCLSAVQVAKAFGAFIDIDKDQKTWIVKGAGSNIHLPKTTVDVGNSGSTLYFFAPVAATFDGESHFTGDDSICKRPVKHLLNALNQLGAEADTKVKGVDAPPFRIKGPINCGRVVTDGRLSQYISGLMMACVRMNGELEIILTDPKEVPYLTMTSQWLEFVGIPVEMSDDYKRICVSGPHSIKAFTRSIPADWEGVAFPLISALISGSDITINGVDCSGSQGDDAIVPFLQSLGADIKLVEDDKLEHTGRLIVNGNSSKKLSTKYSYFEEITKTENGETKTLNISGFPDAICALSVIACFTEGTIILDDTGVCRHKETDRVKVMTNLLVSLGAKVVDGLTLPINDPLYGDRMIIYGDGGVSLHGGVCDSFSDHRVAMSLACMGLGLKTDTITILGAECCSVSFPGFFEIMNNIGAGFSID